MKWLQEGRQEWWRESRRNVERNLAYASGSVRNKPSNKCIHCSPSARNKKRITLQKVKFANTRRCIPAAWLPGARWLLPGRAQYYSPNSCFHTCYFFKVCLSSSWPIFMALRLFLYWIEHKLHSVFLCYFLIPLIALTMVHWSIMNHLTIF